MGKKTVLLSLIVILLTVGIWAVFLNKQKSSLSNPLTTRTKQVIQPSETFTEYSDSSGFSFNYPDNLSITNAESLDNSTYADLTLSSKDVNGSLNLKITDSKFKFLDEWVKLNKQSSVEEPKEVKLGNLKATEIKLNDRLLLGALDQGIFFSIEIPRVEEDFWMKVYNKVLADFSFIAPQANTDSASYDVSFEGEEVVE